MVNFAAGRLYLKRINILTNFFFFTIICIHPLSVTFVPSLSDVGDLSCMPSYLSVSVPMYTLLKLKYLIITISIFLNEILLIFLLRSKDTGSVIKCIYNVYIALTYTIFNSLLVWAARHPRVMVYLHGTLQLRICDSIYNLAFHKS